VEKEKTRPLGSKTLQSDLRGEIKTRGAVTHKKYLSKKRKFSSSCGQKKGTRRLGTRKNQENQKILKNGLPLGPDTGGPAGLLSWGREKKNYVGPLRSAQSSAKVRKEEGERILQLSVAPVFRARTGGY